MLTKIKEQLLYYGVKKDEYLKMLPTFIDDNIRHLRQYSLILSPFFAVLGLISLNSTGFNGINALLYLATACMMTVVALLSHWSIKRGWNSALMGTVLIYLFEVVIFAESLSITARHPDMPGVTIVAVMLILPLLFIDTPIRVCVVQSIYAFVFGFVSSRMKPPEVASVDIWNAITFMVVSYFSTAIAGSIRVKILRQAYQIEYLGRFDALTKVKNRNAYEQDAHAFRADSDGFFCIVYADANGLHELNNTAGHKAGDLMLQTVAAGLKNIFGEEHTYRIGGDEFVGVSTEYNTAVILPRLKELAAELHGKNYHVACGVAETDTEHGFSEIEDLAEKRMYSEKAAYYSRSGMDRRRNRTGEEAD